MQKEPQTIWRLIQNCAISLTKSGHTPFTRGDLIECVQRSNPNYEPNSINPIIQGVTDNLRGGAPGVTGKNILHSVGRGLFVLNKSGTSVSSKPKARSTSRHPKVVSPLLGGATITILGIEFVKVCDMQLELDENGQLQEYLPQDRYKNAHILPLNNYGEGPYCKFKIPRNIHSSGVYIIAVKNEPKYVGECVSLSNRYNMGYGNISPRNCFVGGQETNCRINNLIFGEVKNGISVSLWFHATEQFKQVELSIRNSMKLDWNKA